MKSVIAVVLLGIILTGCQAIAPETTTQRLPAGEIEIIDVDPREPPRQEAPTTQERISRQVAFPADEYAALEKSGSGVISGRLTLSGRPIENRPVSVAPVTTYSAEAAEQALAGRAVERADPRAQEYTQTSYTNSNGHFRIGSLPAGDFYVSSSGQNPVTGETRVVIRQVQLGNGQQREVNLSR
jgi:hypothetical protein